MQKISKHRAALPYIETMAKTAAPTPFFGPGDGKRVKDLAKSVVEVGAVAVPLITLAASGISAAHAKMTAASNKANAFKTMVAENPHLQDHPPDLTQRYFNTLYRLNPELAHDPTVAASFVNNMVQQNNPVQPHAAIYPAARELFSASRGGRQEGYGFANELGKTLGGIASGIRSDRSEELNQKLREMAEAHKVDYRLQQDSLRQKDMQNKVLRSAFHKMKRKAQQGGTY